MDIRLIFLNSDSGALQGRMTTSYTLIGLGEVYGPCVVNNSAEKSCGCDEAIGPVL